MIKWKNEFTYLIIIGLVGLVSVSYGLWNIKDCYEQNNGRAYLIIFTGIYLLLLTLGLILLQQTELKIVLVLIMFIITSILVSVFMYNKKLLEKFGIGSCTVNGKFGYSVNGKECIIDQQPFDIPKQEDEKTTTKTTNNVQTGYGVGSCLANDGSFGYRLPFYKNQCIPANDLNQKLMEVDETGSEKSKLNDYIDSLKKLKKKEEDRLNKLEQERQLKYYSEVCKDIDELNDECNKEGKGLKSYVECPPPVGKYRKLECSDEYTLGHKLPKNSIPCKNLSYLNIDGKPDSLCRELGIQYGSKSINRDICPPDEASVECSIDYSHQLPNKYSRCHPVGTNVKDVCGMDYSGDPKIIYDNCPSNFIRYNCN